MKKGNMWAYHIIALATIAVWGSTFVSTKVLIGHGLTPADIFTLRFVIAYVIIVFMAGRKVFADSVRDELRMAALGITGGSVYFLAENEALVYSTASNVSLIVCSCPLFTTLMYKMVYRNVRLGKGLVTGSILAFVGMATVVLNGRFVLHLSPIGDTLAFVACICWAVYSLLIRDAYKKYSSLFITRKVFFYGIITMLPYYMLKGGMPCPDISSTVVIGNLLFLGVVASMLCFFAWTWCMRNLGAVRTTNYVYLNPITTIVLGNIILQERITAYFVVGTALILAGLYLCNKRYGDNQLED